MKNLQVRENSCLTFDLEYQSFTAFGLELKYKFFLGLENVAFGLELISLALPVLRLSDLNGNYTGGSLESLFSVSILPIADLGTSRAP